MTLNQLSAVRAAASADGHRALVLVRCPADGALGTFANACGIPFIAASHASDRADRISDVLGSEFDILVHQTDEIVDVGLLAALAGTVKAGGLLILGLHHLPSADERPSSCSPSSFRFLHLLSEMQSEFPDKVVFLTPRADELSPKPTTPSSWLADLVADVRTIQDKLSLAQSAGTPPHQIAASREQDQLLQLACNYLQHHQQGCITITGRRGRGKSALLGRIASWLKHQQITFAVTAARQSALASMQNHSTGTSNFLAAEAAHLSGCSVLLVDEASSLPLSLLERFLATHNHVIYCTTVEGYENVGRAFAIRFHCVANQYHAHALALEPCIPWRWNAGDPLEHLINGLLLGSSDIGSVPSSWPTESFRLQHHSPGTDTPPPPRHIHLLDRASLALDEALLREVYGLLRDTHYQTRTVDLSHLLDAPDLQLWVLEEDGHIQAVLLLVMEGEIDPDLHEAIVSKQRRLPHQLLPQLLAQSADQSNALQAVYGRVIRIAVASKERRRGLGTQLLQAVERIMTSSASPAGGLGASFASDTASIAFWKKNGYEHFHTGFKPNPRTGKPAIAVIKSLSPSLDAVVQAAVAIHADNQRWQSCSPERSEDIHFDAALLRRFATGQRSMHDTYAALCRLAQQQHLPLKKASGISQRQYEAALRKAVAAVLT